MYNKHRVYFQTFISQKCKSIKKKHIYIHTLKNSDCTLFIITNHFPARKVKTISDPQYFMATSVFSKAAWEISTAFSGTSKKTITKIKNIFLFKFSHRDLRSDQVSARQAAEVRSCCSYSNTQLWWRLTALMI